ncbi:siphovirus Gp157 family protein [Clostridium sp.]|uniref:siphovirus Gp157 family protein n=1 Tax=Clostridium sp. TaxID=1506 RepID=UPI0025B94723|nr:siphovirus Gp157 family protein [Clostridium sp.]
MANLYQISDKLMSIFNNVEANDGEITEEELKELEITKDQLDEKLTQYKRAILNWQSDVVSCKEEEKRIKENRIIKEHRIERLKNYMLDAVVQFGCDGKGKNKYYDLADGKIYTRGTDEVLFNEDRINKLIKLCYELATDENYVYDETNILEKINNLKNTYYEYIEDYTEDDLKYLSFTFEDYITINDIFTKYLPIIKTIFKESDYSIPIDLISNSTSKLLIKPLLNNNTINMTTARINHNTSLIIK